MSLNKILCGKQTDQTTRNDESSPSLINSPSEIRNMLSFFQDGFSNKIAQFRQTYLTLQMASIKASSKLFMQTFQKILTALAIKFVLKNCIILVFLRTWYKFLVLISFSNEKDEYHLSVVDKREANVYLLHVFTNMRCFWVYKVVLRHLTILTGILTVFAFI